MSEMKASPKTHSPMVVSLQTFNAILDEVADLRKKIADQEEVINAAVVWFHSVSHLKKQEPNMPHCESFPADRLFNAIGKYFGLGADMSVFQKWYSDEGRAKMAELCGSSEEQIACYKEAFKAGLFMAANIADDEKHKHNSPSVEEDVCLDIYHAIVKAAKEE